MSFDVKYTKLFINNKFVDSVNGKTFSVLNPSTGKKIVDVSEADKDDVELAVSAARKAFSRNSQWRKIDASQRGVLLNKFIDLIQRDREYLAKLETLNNGKPYKDSLFDIQGTIDVLRYYAGYCDKIHGHTIPSDGDFFTVTRKEPIGVVAQIIPWNYPMLMLAWKWGPALATGCTVILKPAEQTPLTALYLASLIVEAGFPEGVVNVLPGYGSTGEALSTHSGVDKIAFTGSSKIGHRIMENAAKTNLKTVGLELGGKSPLVIFDDVDLNEAVEVAFNAIFANHGQNCCAGSRTFVQSGIYNEFVKRAVQRAKERKVGDPFADVDQGPQIDKKSLDKIIRLVKSGVAEGATLETGGHRIGDVGFFFEPTVFSNVTDNMAIATEEIFGPVQCIFKFDTLDEVISRANNTQYGLAAGVMTKNIDTALVFAQAVQAGSVWVNCYDAITPQTPFGGYKMSGNGRELGADSLNEYLETKTISIKVPTKV